MGYGVTSATLLVAAGSARPPPRRPSTSPRSAPRWCRASPTTRSATPTGAPSASWRCPASSAPSPARRCWSTSTPTSPSRWSPAILIGLGHLRHLAVPLPAQAPLRAAAPAPASSRRSGCSPARSTRSVAAAGVRSAPRRCWPPAGSSRARSSARSTPPSSWSRSAARSASWSRSAPRASSGRYVGALMVGGVVAAPIAATLVRYLPARVLGVAAGGLIVLTNLQTLAEVADVPGVTDRAARLDGLHALGAVDRLGGQARAGRPRGRCRPAAGPGPGAPGRRCTRG